MSATSAILTACSALKGLGPTAELATKGGLGSGWSRTQLLRLPDAILTVPTMSIPTGMEINTRVNTSPLPQISSALLAPLPAALATITVEELYALFASLLPISPSIRPHANRDLTAMHVVWPIPNALLPTAQPSSTLNCPKAHQQQLTPRLRLLSILMSATSATRLASPVLKD